MFDIIGSLGAFLIIFAYFLLLTEKTAFNSFTYLILNFIGSLLIIISLLKNFNLGSFIIEIFWVLITLYGILRLLTIKKMN